MVDTMELVGALMKAHEAWKEMRESIQEKEAEIDEVRSQLQEAGINITLEDFDAAQTTPDLRTGSITPGLPENDTRSPETETETAQEALDKRSAEEIRSEALGMTDVQDQAQFASSIGDVFERAVQSGFDTAGQLQPNQTGWNVR